MRRLAIRSRNARRNGWTGAEHLGVNAFRRYAQGCKPRSQIVHEGRRPADIEITIARQIKPLEQSHIEVTKTAKINIGPVLGIGRAVANVAVAVGKRGGQAPALL